MVGSILLPAELAGEVVGDRVLERLAVGRELQIHLGAVVVPRVEGHEALERVIERGPERALLHGEPLMHDELDDAALERALHEEPAVTPTPQFSVRVMQAVRDEAEGATALPFPWLRFGLGPVLATLVVLMTSGSVHTAAANSTVPPVVAQAVALLTLTLAGTFALLAWSLRLGRR